jgi:hypothetical protein
MGTESKSEPTRRWAIELGLKVSKLGIRSGHRSLRFPKASDFPRQIYHFIERTSLDILRFNLKNPEKSAVSNDDAPIGIENYQGGLS